MLWDLNRDRTVELPFYGDDSAGAATAINDRGHVVGISGTCDQSVGRHTARHAVLWQNGTVKNLGNLGGDTWNTPTAITRRGDIVVGFASSPGDDPDSPMLRAFLWTERSASPAMTAGGTLSARSRPNSRIAQGGSRSWKLRATLLVLDFAHERPS